jgi:lipopolysaccharide exporter
MPLTKRLARVGIGTAGAMLATLIATPIITRLYDPLAYAGWALFASVAAFVSNIACLRYELAVVLPEEKRLAAAVAVAGLGVATIVAIFALLVPFLALPAAWNIGAFTGDNRWLMLLPLTVVGWAIYQISMSWCTREADFVSYAVIQVAWPLSALVPQITVGLLGYRSDTALIASGVLGQLLVAVLCAAVLGWRERRILLEVATLSEVWGAARAYWRYPAFVTPNTLVGVARERLAYLILASSGSPVAVGYYGLVSRFLNIPNSFVSSTVRPVFFHFSSKNSQFHAEKAVGLLVRTLGICGAVVWGAAVQNLELMMVLAFGREWAAAAPFAYPLSLPAIALLMGNWADRIFDVLNAQRRVLAMEVGFSVVAMAGLSISYLVSNELLTAVWFQSVLMTVYYLFWLAFLFRTAKYSLARLSRIFAEVGAAGAVSWAGAYFLRGVLPGTAGAAISFVLATVVSVGVLFSAYAALKRLQPLHADQISPLK